MKKLAAKRDLEGMIKALGYQQDSRVRFDAVQALGRLAEARAVEPLIRAHHDQDSDVPTLVVWTLGTLGDPCTVESLIDALHDKDEDEDVRSQMVWMLGTIDDDRAVEPLMGALRDRDEDVRDLAANALQAIAARTSPSPPPG